MTSNELRQTFLNFFERRGHKIIHSASLVPDEKIELSGTKRVLFTTAGMHPLIPYLLGQSHPEGKRLVNVQKCLRTDDIDEVGDQVHNTFFEMLGNWSLGDPASRDSIGQGGYWKEDAISWSYEFLIDQLKLDAGRLYVSVFAGDKDAPFDGESFNIWKKLGVPEDHIFKYPKNDNWWGPVGEVGPCGSDTEMFYDLDPKKGKADPASDSNRFVEVWNDVFMQYDKQKDGSFKPLAQRNVDTGMGLERMLAVLNNCQTIYETDLFYPIIQKIEDSSVSSNIRASRIIADHIKAAVFLLSEGILPSNLGRGYVLRRLIRRAIRYASQIGLRDVFNPKLIKVVVDIYKESYPNLSEQQESIYKELLQEEERFEKAVREGLKKSEKVFAKKRPISPAHYAKIMQTPDKKEIFRYLYRKKNPKDVKFGGGVSKKEIEEATVSGKEAFDLYQTFGFPPDMIIELAQAKRLVVDIEGLERETEKHKKLSQKLSAGKFRGGLVNESKRAVWGHTATHLLHQALRDVLGDHVHQTGSNITEERLRFDFTHPAKLNPDQIKKVEKIVNQKIRGDLKVTKELVSQEDAERKGAIGLFKEKYGDKVNIYMIGGYSIEYCGGPHAQSTGELGSFKIIKEESAGAGIRRVYGKIG